MKSKAELSQRFSLSTRWEVRLQNHWNKRLQEDPFPLAPSELVKQGLVDQERHDRENWKFDSFASEYKVAAVQKKHDLIQRHRKFHFCMLSFGWGVDLNAGWVLPTLARMVRVMIFDISEFACSKAETKLHSLLRELEPFEREHNIRILSVYEAEMERVIDEYESPNTVLLIDLTRILICLSKRARKRVLQKIGKRFLSAEADPNKQCEVIVIQAFADDNPSASRVHSQPVTVRQVVVNLSRGAGRKIKAHNRATHSYYDGYKTIAAWTFSAV
ncbi:MAG: hypothetical protein HYV13_02465 [Candidatus Doudnabacteria bacterium]|nr:hypothetical protein [Candidatus Doudnabacteria bacterium]